MTGNSLDMLIRCAVPVNGAVAMAGGDVWRPLWLSVQVAFVAVVIMLPFGIAIGWLLARRRFPGRTLVDGLVHLPLVLPPVVVGYVLLMLLGRRGVIGGWLHDQFAITIGFTFAAAVIASAVMGFPLLVRSIRLSMELADRRYEAAARTLGAGPWRVFWTVTVPLAFPGIATGVLLAFARSLGEFGATITFAGNIEGETRTLPLAVFSYTQTPGGDAAAMRLVLISIALSLGALIASELLTRRMKRAVRA